MPSPALNRKVMATRALNPRRPLLGIPRSRRRRPARRAPASGVLLLRRRVVAGVVLVLALYIAYMFWFRDLSLFAVEKVTVKGASTSRADITKALERVSGDMTTLHLNDGELRDAVSGFPTVASMSAETSFPHGLTVTITERLPVATVRLDGRTVPVSADGYVLQGADFDAKSLPQIQGADARGLRLVSAAAVQAAVLGAAPRELRDRISASAWDSDRGGVVVDLDGAPELRFGDASRVADKWAAAIAVLEGPDPPSPGYLDVSVPERPVSGG